jgi:hypothetical protein
MSFTFKRTGDADYPKHLKILVMGSPKAGKTTFVSTAPNVVVAALPDAGLMSVAHKNMPYVDIEDISTLQTLLMVLTDETLRERAAANLGLPQIETVAIDTLDALQEIQKKEILKANKSSEMRQADWGKLKEHMAAIIKGFVALPMNVIFTVHTTTMQDDEQKIIQVPALQGAIKDEIAGWVDFALLAERKREMNTQGVPEIKYYLKAEGDQKNPHLGNRAAGRVPEYVEPDFKVLHDAVFSGIGTMLKTQTIEADTGQTTVVNVTNVAQPLSQPRSAPPITPTAPTGVPQTRDDSDEPINATGIKALTKMFTELLVPVPDFTHPAWTLGFGRETAKMIQAMKADEATGHESAGKGLVEWLAAFEIPGYVVPETAADEVPTPVETEEVAPKARKRAAKKVEPSAATAEEATVGEAELDAAVSLATQQLGATVIGERVTEGALCAECGKPVDDLDVANLALGRYRRTLCVADYMTANRQK